MEKGGTNKKREGERSVERGMFIRKAKKDVKEQSIKDSLERRGEGEDGRKEERDGARK